MTEPNKARWGPEIPETSWNQLLKERLKVKGDTLVQLCISLDDTPPLCVPLDHCEFCKLFDPSYGHPEGCSFTAWGEKYVYFPATYDGKEWIEAVPRNPELHATEHVGCF